MVAAAGTAGSGLHDEPPRRRARGRPAVDRIQTASAGGKIEASRLAGRLVVLLLIAYGLPGGLLRAVEDQNLNRAFLRLQSEPKLLLQGRGKGGGPFSSDESAVSSDLTGRIVDFSLGRHAGGGGPVPANEGGKNPHSGGCVGWHPNAKVGKDSPNHPHRSSAFCFFFSPSAVPLLT